MSEGEIAMKVTNDWFDSLPAAHGLPLGSRGNLARAIRRALIDHNKIKFERFKSGALTLTTQASIDHANEIH